jgi:hypothetical protein
MPLPGMGMPPMGGMPPGMGGGMPPMGGPGAGMGGNELPELAYSSLDQLSGGGQSNVLERVTNALGLTHKLLLSVLPQVSSINPGVAKDLHQVAQRVVQIQLDIRKETPIGEPPAELMALLNSGDETGVPPKPSPSPMMPGM